MANHAGTDGTDFRVGRVIVRGVAAGDRDLRIAGEGHASNPLAQASN